MYNNFLFLFKQKLIILIFTLFSFCIGIIIAFTSPVQYCSSSKLVFKFNNQRPSQLNEIAQLTGISFGNQNASPVDYLDWVVQDQYFLKRIISKKWFIGNDSVFLQEYLWPKFVKSQLNVNKEITNNKIIEMVRNGKYITLEKDPKTQVLTLTTTFPNPLITLNINLSIINNLNDYVLFNYKTQAKEKRLFIEERITEVKNELEKAENNLVRFRERNIMSKTPDIILQEMRFTRQVTLNQELYLQLQRQYEAVKIEEKNDQLLIEVVKTPDLPLSRSKPKRKEIIALTTVIGISLIISVLLSIKTLSNLLNNKY